VKPMAISKCGKGALLCLSIFASLAALPCWAQTQLSVEEAVRKALDSRASLKAEAERITGARGLKEQAGLLPNPEFQFSNENLRPGQTYTKDVDTYAFFVHPLDVLGKRRQRIAVAEGGVNRSQAEYELARLQVAQRVKLAYWAARGAQGTRDLLKASVKNFQAIVDYHSARLSQGMLSEQDFLRVRLESERLQIAANLAAIEATRARVQLLREMGQTDFAEIVLTDPLDSNGAPPGVIEIPEVLARRIEMRVATAAVEEAKAKAEFEDVSARPDLNLIYGYKRTQLPDSPTTGTNSAMAGLQITLPVTNRNQGNRAAAAAELRRQQLLLAATEAEVRADYFSALQEYQLRSGEVVTTLEPLRQHAKNIAEIAQGAYVQGGTDLLRLLDAQRVRLDAELAYVQGMVAYQQSIANLQAAEGANP
jgi:cobalt-zinc-cadmium efflux system outer membrane protein